MTYLPEVLRCPPPRPSSSAFLGLAVGTFYPWPAAPQCTKPSGDRGGVVGGHDAVALGGLGGLALGGYLH